MPGYETVRLVFLELDGCCCCWCCETRMFRFSGELGSESGADNDDDDVMVVVVVFVGNEDEYDTERCLLLLLVPLLLLLGALLPFIIAYSRLMFVGWLQTEQNGGKE